jgi:carbon-monoxide dehydrogenase medium subunit
MYPASFEYGRPNSVDEAIEMLRVSKGAAKLLAGGHSLLPLMKLRLAEPAMVVDIGRLKNALAYVRSADGQVHIGAMTTHHTLESSADLRRLAPIVGEAAAVIGDMQVRNRGTIGGSLVHGDPGADLPAVMLALDARLVVKGPNGERVIPADQFFLDVLTTAVTSEEILTEVRLPALTAGTGAAYRKMEQPASGFAIAGIAALVRLEGETIRAARIGVTGVAATPYRATASETALVGKQATTEAIGEAASHAADGVDVQGDMHAAADYRAHLARVFTRRALEGAIAQARAS